LCGDAAYMWRHFLPDPTVEIEALCIEYNRQVPEALRALTTLQIDTINVLSGTERNTPMEDLTTYRNWIHKWIQFQPDVDYRFFHPNHDLTPMPLKTPPSPNGYITLQLSSKIHPFKDMGNLFGANYPLPTKTIAMDTSLIHGEPVVGRSLTEVGEILLGANLHVGVDSGITVLAALLGIKTIVAGWAPSLLD